MKNLPSSSFSSRTSGDWIADRRLAYGQAAFEEGDFITARDLFEQTLEIAPRWAVAFFMLGRSFYALDAREKAIAAWKKTLEIEPEDALGASVWLSHCGDSLGESNAAMPLAYIRTLFDDYAPRFNQHLVETLHYCAPTQIFTLLREAEACAFWPKVLDLGCGTGLMAQALAGHNDICVGVDLSPAMLQMAEKTGCYARLVCDDLCAALAQETETFNLVVAADVFCYIPNLQPVVSLVYDRLEADGVFAFSIETFTPVSTTKPPSAIIGEDGRVHHRLDYIDALADENGFEILIKRESSTRLNRAEPVLGALFVLRKKA